MSHRTCLWLFKWPPDIAVSLIALKCLFRGTGLVGGHKTSVASKEDQDKHGHSRPLNVALGYSFCSGSEAEVVLQWNRRGSGNRGRRKKHSLILGKLAEWLPSMGLCKWNLHLPSLLTGQRTHSQIRKWPASTGVRTGRGGGNTGRECCILFNLALPTPNPFSVMFL